MTATVAGIRWETDGEEVKLPDTVIIGADADDTDDDIVNKVSDKYGWLINGIGSIARKGKRNGK